ncbi:MAG: cytochrome b/b6 domain-containing protein [Thioalkalivibrionaceae bacterium]
MIQDGRTRLVGVWDWPVRFSHWAIVLLLPAAWYTAGDITLFRWHQAIGITLIGVLIFRVGWGIFGSETARFSRFVRGPVTVWAYLCGRVSAGPGHSPLAALSVLALFGVLMLQAVSGLFSSDDIFNSGPLAGEVSREARRWWTRLHHGNFDVLLGLIALHLAAVAFYEFVRRRRLVGPMLHGKKTAQALELDAGSQVPPRLRRPWWGAVWALIVAVPTVWIVVELSF